MDILKSRSIAPFKSAYITLILLVLAVAIAANKEPLEGMHWDVPIYLNQAKLFAESAYLDNYTHQAAKIAASVKEHVGDEYFSHAFWHFIRLGHIVILGSIVVIFGNSLAAIIAATWLYVGLLIGGLGFCFGNVLVLVKDNEYKRCYHLGAVISVMLFLLSDIYRYLAGNLVSEVLAIFLLAGAVFALLQAIKTDRLSLAVLSGLLAFLSYAVRMESIWTWLAFILAYLSTSGGGSCPRIPWQALLTASLTAGLAYGTYAICFYPLTNPVYFLQFVAGLSISQHHNGVPAYQLLFVVGGMLWLGAGLSFWWIGRSGFVRLGGAWLLLVTLPWLPQILLGGPTQTRMMSSLILPLFLLSSAGWGLLLARADKLALTATSTVALAMALLSQPLVNNAFQHFPGGWRVQYAHPFLFAPKYERIDYPAADVEALSPIIYHPAQTTVLVVPKSEYSYVYLSLFHFFAPNSIHASEQHYCEDAKAISNVTVVFCEGYAKSIQNYVKRILILRRLGTPMTPNSTVVFTTPGFALDKLDN